VTATSRAFAALLADGTVVCWGSPENGGDSKKVRDRLRGWKNHGNFMRSSPDLTTKKWDFSQKNGH